MSGPELITLGCRLNSAESEAMRALGSGRDDLVIVNSCAVTAEAVRKTRQEIRKARAEALRAASARRRKAWLATLIGTEQRVLIERKDGRGHAENFAEAAVMERSGPGARHSRFRGNDDVGRVKTVRITAVRDTLLLAEPA